MRDESVLTKLADNDLDDLLADTISERLVVNRAWTWLRSLKEATSPADHSEPVAIIGDLIAVINSRTEVDRAWRARVTGWLSTEFWRGVMVGVLGVAVAIACVVVMIWMMGK